MTRRSAFTRPATYPSSVSLMREDPEDIVGEGEDHHRKEHDESYLRQACPQLERERLPADRLGNEKHQLTTIQNRDRQQVQDREVDREQGEERQKPVEAESRHLAGVLAHGDDAAHVAHGRLMQDESLQEAEDEDHLTPGFLEPREDGLAQRLTHVDGRRILPGADGAVHVGTRGRWVGLGPRFRRHRHLERLAATKHIDLKRFPGAPPDEVEHVAPRPQRIAVDLEQEVSGLQARPNGGPAGLENPEFRRVEPDEGLRQCLARAKAMVGQLHDDRLRTAGHVDPEVRRASQQEVEQHIPRTDGVAVHAHDLIAELEAGECLRTGRQAAHVHRVDPGAGQFWRTRRGRDAGVHEEREHDVHRHARDDHDAALPHRLAVEGPRRIDRHIGLASFERTGHAFVLEPGHLDVAAERHARDPVFGLPAPPAQDRFAEPKRKAQHLDPQTLRGHEMTHFVHEDQDAEDDDDGAEREEHVASRASRRASASAASTASSDSASVGSYASSTLATVSAMRPNRIRPSRNRSTATSFAALNAVVVVPPAAAAARPDAYAGYRAARTGSNVRVPAATGSMRRASSVGRRPVMHCSTALCSESTGMISPPPRRAARVTSSPAMTNVSLFASATRLPASSAASVASRPAAPTMPLSTICTSGRVAASTRQAAPSPPPCPLFPFPEFTSPTYPGCHSAA